MILLMLKHFQFSLHDSMTIDIYLAISNNCDLFISVTMVTSYNGAHH